MKNIVKVKNNVLAGICSLVLVVGVSLALIPMSWSLTSANAAGAPSCKVYDNYIKYNTKTIAGTSTKGKYKGKGLVQITIKKGSKTLGTGKTNANGKGTFKVALKSKIKKGSKFTITCKNLQTKKTKTLTYQTAKTHSASLAKVAVSKTLGKLPVAYGDYPFKFVSNKKPTLNPIKTKPTYTQSSEIGKSKVPTTKNVMTTKKYSTSKAKFTFKSKFFLPLDWTIRDSAFSNAQSAQIVNVKGHQYLYEVVSSVSQNKLTSNNATNESAKGRIIRYDYDKLLKLKADSTNWTALRHASAKVADHEFVTPTEQKVLDCVLVGPEFAIGHGQGLAYNYKTGSLWMMYANKIANKSGAYKGQYKNTLYQIDLKKLSPVKQLNFYMTKSIRNSSATGSSITGSNNLAFDEAGNFYLNVTQKTPGTGNYATPAYAERIYTGVLNEATNQVTGMKVLRQHMKYSPGYNDQNLNYNPKNNRLYVVSDFAMYSIPVSKLRSGTVKSSDVRLSEFTTHRETESITWDKSGHPLILKVRGPELMYSSTKDTK
ncbi:MAG: hypothetical protein LBM13_02615 [Candidatus Ancillula sp.]|jgi:hypothetical protein|nr:hypothetical protein [Candidatus Ancillula sp.]